jgi:hypothetical protein
MRPFKLQIFKSLDVLGMLVTGAMVAFIGEVSV